MILRAALAALVVSIGPAHAVIGGDPPPAGDPVAAHVAMLTTPDGFCSATALSARVFLTAAHCLDGGRRVAILRFDADRRPMVTEVVERVVHPDYRRADWQARRASVDLALVVTASPVAGPRPASLSSTGVPAAGAGLVLYGFGPSTEGDARSAGVLRRAALTATGRPSTFQVRLSGPGQSPRGACVGDSGGPVFQGGAVAGVVSWTTGEGAARCGRLTGVVPVAPHRTWIAETARRLSAR